MASIPERFSDAIETCLPNGPPPRIGVALSGGGDSTALLVLLAEWARPLGISVQAITVDHGLREASAGEAEQAGRSCATLGVGHHIRSWDGSSRRGNLQAAARRARRDLVREWAGDLGLVAVALGHTMDDQAETFLMRLKRGSGVDGLAAMAARRLDDGIVWLRPLLEFRREELRDILRDRNIGWSEDPSNEDARFDRVRTRRALAELDGLGISVEKLAETATRMASGRQALEAATQRAARKTALVSEAGDVELRLGAFSALEPEFQMRLLAHAVKWVASASYRARQSAIAPILTGLADLRRTTLGGCLVSVERKAGIVRICREARALQDAVGRPGEVWDGRGIVTGPPDGALYHIAVLGEAGLKAVPNWKSTGLARASLLASPSVWLGKTLVSAPLAGAPNGWDCRLRNGADHFFTSILSH
ncbi:MAG: tRNA lysidine(34) synthetase TilS [Paracoccaceae bacterium]